MNEDRFLERLRDDARQLRYEVDPVAASRLAARVRARVMQPTIAELMAAWLRPLAASLTALALAAAIGLSIAERNQTLSFTGDSVEVAVGGDVYSVVE